MASKQSMERAEKLLIRLGQAQYANTKKELVIEFIDEYLELIKEAKPFMAHEHMICKQFKIESEQTETKAWLEKAERLGA
jgi:hypothetical protein